MSTRTQAIIRAATWTLEAILRDRTTQHLLTCERVTDADLGDPKSELWLAAHLRRGRLGVLLDEMKIRVVPEFVDAEEQLVKRYRLETTAGGKVVSLDFTPDSLDSAAQRGAQRLLAEGRLAAGDLFTWEIVATPRDIAERDATPADDVIIRETPRPLEYFRIPIDTVRQNARLIGESDDRQFPVYYIARALVDASRFAWAGSALDKPVETGAGLIGVPCSCPVTGEFFVIIIAAVPIEQAREERYSLTPSAASWQQIDARLDELRGDGFTPARLVGEAHSHPFGPGGSKTDPAAETEFCSNLAHSAYASRDDVAWSRAVFSREPWQLAHIFGLSRDGRRVHALFGLRDATLAQRGFAVIPQFKPEWIECS